MRFSEIDELVPDQLDFVPRERRNQMSLLVIAFVTTMAVIFIAAYAPVIRDMNLYTPIITIVAIAALCLYVVYSKQLNLDLVMSTEYQNLMFAQAVRVGCDFCMFVRRDGTIIYASDGMNSVFPSYDYAEAQALDGVFELAAVRQVDRERILGAIRSNSNDNLIFPIPAAAGGNKNYVLTVEPLPRPAGFSVVRGREYLGVRTGSQLLPDILRSTSVDKLDHMLATTPAALYTTDPFGRFEYVNPALEKMLGYAPGGIIDGKLSLHHLLFSLGEQVITEEYALSDYTGQAVLLRRGSGRVGAALHQQVLRDAQGKVIGATGTLLSTNPV